MSWGGVHENTIIEALYLEPPDTGPLRLDGLTYPSAHSPMRHIVTATSIII